jgi:hypothetical protein
MDIDLNDPNLLNQIPDIVNEINLDCESSFLLNMSDIPQSECCFELQDSNCPQTFSSILYRKDTQRNEDETDDIKNKNKVPMEVHGEIDLNQLENLPNSFNEDNKIGLPE